MAESAERDDARAALAAERAKVGRLQDCVYTLIAYATDHGVNREALYCDVVGEALQHGDLSDESEVTT